MDSYEFNRWLRRLVGPLIPGSLRKKLGPVFNPRIAFTAKLYKRDKITLGKDTFIDHYCILRPAEGHISFGNHSYLGPFGVILASGGVEIGDDVMIGPHVVFASGNHDFQRPGFLMRELPMVATGPIVVENDVWIGTHSVICDNVRIATGCVIGAGAVVTRSTEPYGIYAGVPAKRIGTRPKTTSKEEIATLSRTSE